MASIAIAIFLKKALLIVSIELFVIPGRSSEHVSSVKTVGINEEWLLLQNNISAQVAYPSEPDFTTNFIALGDFKPYGKSTLEAVAFPSKSYSPANTNSGFCALLMK